MKEFLADSCGMQPLLNGLGQAAQNNLSAEEEFQMAQKMRENPDSSAIWDFISHYIFWGVKKANELYNTYFINDPAYEQTDIIEEAIIALEYAARHYNPEKSRFTCFSELVIVQRITKMKKSLQKDCNNSRNQMYGKTKGMPLELLACPSDKESEDLLVEQSVYSDSPLSLDASDENHEISLLDRQGYLEEGYSLVEIQSLLSALGEEMGLYLYQNIFERQTIREIALTAGVKESVLYFRMRKAKSQLQRELLEHNLCKMPAG